MKKIFMIICILATGTCLTLWDPPLPRAEPVSILNTEPSEQTDPDLLNKLSEASAPVQPAKHEPLKTEPPARASLLAAGDNLIHDIIYQTAEKNAGKPGEYDFLPFYAYVRKTISSADIAVLNQETPLAGSYPPSSFPLFNSPPILAEQLAEIGFDVVNVANNHMLDQNSGGLLETLDSLRAVSGLTAIGGFKTREAQNEIAVIERGGITFAFLGYTQFTNGLILPEDRQYCIVYTDDRGTIARQLAAARKAADVVVVNVHWGDEYSSVPTAYQKELAQFFADCGADVIFGHHPHVLQPADNVKASDGREVPVFYSLGNFFSAQHQARTMIGAMAYLAFEKDSATGEILRGETVIIPVITHFNSYFGDFSIYPLKSYTNELAAVHAVRTRFGEPFSLDWIKQHAAASCGKEFEVEGVE